MTQEQRWYAIGAVSAAIAILAVLTLQTAFPQLFDMDPAPDNPAPQDIEHAWADVDR